MKLFVFGLGYSASQVVRQHGAAFTHLWGTVRAPAKPEQDGATLLRFDGSAVGAAVDPRLPAALADADALLVSVQPGLEADPVLAHFASAIAAAPNLRRIVYLSTIGVYGGHGGAWIDEEAATMAGNPRQAARIRVEAEWLALGARAGVPVSVLRLAGIYGPGRNALDDLRAGEARRIDKPGQVFNRIHVTDIGHAVMAALAHPAPPRLVNVTDDEPAPAPDVVAYAASLMGIAPPGLIPFATAELSPMARSFYGANRRVRNAVLRRDLGVDLAFPTYRAGLDALWASGEGRS
ncbi:NAD(P)-dependent oxidoreductase [Lichenihabitans sp. Uapishka_5]|uniref:NAD-dependent epimerase/dehydratase family protein n=1 Tax=Lichenihabitans sp. Uapishka_5 TaxID=3037302 RepID=UPI0029E7ED91|nr:NAD-dependent epimerase/dehydratase family protein [Lichenihabitans sp. Uapishka_5]MDX7951865.1 NAD(P)-dependent oxidoreductase [Lichenihabitans sp. Uapishka_5]